MRRYNTLFILWLCLLPLALWAQGYSSPDVSRFHYSTVYYVTLQNAAGESINHQYTRSDGAIGAFVGDELRGVSHVGHTDPTGGSPVFVIRVWGDDSDPAVVSFRLREQRTGLEYVIDNRLFGRGQELTVGEPSNPVAMTLIPIEGVRLPSENITVLQGSTASARVQYFPNEHSQLLSNLREEYVSGDENIFTVSNDGIVTGVSRGSASIVANVYFDEQLCFSIRGQVSVITDKVAVTGIRNDMESLNIEKREGEQFRLNFTVLPTNATNRMVTYTLGDYSIINMIQEDEHAIPTFVAARTGETTITVKTVDGGYELVYNVKVVENPDLVVHVKGIVADPDAISTYVGERFGISYEVLPNNATDKSVDITVDNNNVLRIESNDTFTALSAGTAHITITSRDDTDIKATITVTVKEVPAITLAFTQTDVVLSKLHDIALVLTSSGAEVLPNRIELVFDNHPTGGWGTVGTATKADATGLRWNARARFVGNYQVRLRYNGAMQASVCNIHVPAEYPFEPGWNWLSLHTVSAAQGYGIPLTQELKNHLTTGENNGVVEIRSQEHLLYYDPALGFFGDIESLTPNEGTYKVKCVFEEDEDDGDADDDLSRYADRMYFTTSYDQLVNSSTLGLPAMQNGYAWITYPHENDHSLDALIPHLSHSAYDEDKIISKDGFAEYDGDEWVCTEGFYFKAGQGYLYYSTSDGGKSIDWGPATLAPEPALASSRGSARTVAALAKNEAEEPWQALSHPYPDCMPVVARIDGIADAKDYVIGAFVADECRGTGRSAANGLMYIAVSGTRGEMVTFRLYHQPSGRFIDIDHAPLRFNGQAGSHRHPLVLAADAQGISSLMDEGTTLRAALSDGRVSVSGAAHTPTIMLYNAQGHLLARHSGRSFALPRLAPGVYMVQVADGVQKVIIKVKQ